jgi:hypothetical protein
MVLVGYEGKKRYLLQNWCKTKPYIEFIHFIKEKQMEMGEYPTNPETLVECASDFDCSENFIAPRTLKNKFRWNFQLKELRKKSGANRAWRLLFCHSIHAGLTN